MAKAKNTIKSREVAKPAAEKTAAPAVQSHAFRETVESIVIAFVLAFLFRVFEAEAFVIPTGSMAPTLMGRHKDVDCPKCGYRYQVSASEEVTDDPNNRPPSDCVSGMCPMCHYVMPMVPRDALPNGVPERELAENTGQRSYNGDRILVNKYIYTFSDPQRWDIVVFKFPGDAKINYIKRLVGLPGETVRVHQGDLFIGGGDASKTGDFEITRKPADKVLAMRQLVHDTDYDPAELDAANWPLRWQPHPESGANSWKVNKTVEGDNVRQRYEFDGKGDETAWLYYNHFQPNYQVWQRLADNNIAAATNLPTERTDAGSPRPRLVMDSNPYNGRVDRANMPFLDRLEASPLKQGIHWVGDLMLEVDVAVDAAGGELLLELVEAGEHFRCTIDFSSGAAVLSAGKDSAYAPKAKTSLNRPGDYRVAFANVDDQLLLWVDGDLVTFDSPTEFDAEKVFGGRDAIRPRTSDKDPGDFAPARIGARNAKLDVTRLQLWRDIYYIADKAVANDRSSPLISEYGSVDWETLMRLPYDPSLWNVFANRQHVDFPLGADQFFVMGDNSAESSDARLWTMGTAQGGKPGGHYLERPMLIGKALFVYWPHSWNRIPGTPIPFPLFPNFEDMRLVR